MAEHIPTRFVALDIETTDLKPETGDIIEIGAVRFEQGKPSARFQTFLRPAASVPPFITALTGITDDMVSDAPQLEEMREKVVDFVGTDTIIGHNIAFDLSFLKEKGIQFPHAKDIDTWPYAAVLMPELPSHSLEHLTQVMGIVHEHRHRAADDAEASGHLFVQLLRKARDIDSTTLEAMVRVCSKNKETAHFLFAALLAERSDRGTQDSLLSLPVRKSVSVAEAHGAESKKPATQDAHIAEALTRGGVHVFEIYPEQDYLQKHVAALIEHAVDAEKGIVLAAATPHTRRELLRMSAEYAKHSARAWKVSALFAPHEYLCKERFDRFLMRESFTRTEVVALLKLLMWLRSTGDGVIAEVRFSPDEWQVVRHVVASDDHAAVPCAHKDACFVRAAMLHAKTAHVIITSHAFLLSEKKLPAQIRSAVLCEAELLEAEYTRTHTERVGSGDVLALGAHVAHFENALAKTLHHRTPQLDAALTALAQTRTAIDTQAALFFGIAGMMVEQDTSAFSFGKIAVDATMEDGTHYIHAQQSVLTLIDRLSELAATLKNVARILHEPGTSSEEAATHAREARRSIDTAERIQHTLRYWFSHYSSDDVREIGVRSGSVLISRMPATCAHHLDFLRSSFYACVMMGVALSLDGDFSYFLSRIGMEDAVTEELAPSTAARALLLQVVSDAKTHEQKKYSVVSSRIIESYVRTLPASVVVLVGSQSVAAEAYEQLVPALEDTGREVLAVSVSGGATKVFERFEESEKAVLIATHTLWNDRDVSRCPISAMIVTKLPFLPPANPLVQARSAGAVNVFTDFALPAAALTLKKAIAQMLLSPNGPALVVITDERIYQKKYGDIFLRLYPRAQYQTGPLADVLPKAEEAFKKEHGGS